MLKSINLSLSVLCSARCVYCPQNRGENIKEKTMPVSLVSNIIEDIRKQDIDIEEMQLSENGDALLNPNFIEILRMLKSELPSVKKILYTNLSLLTKEKSEIILKEGLIDRLMCSIDSIDEDIFFMMNGLNLKKVLKNFRDFLSIRDGLNSPVSVTVRSLTLHSYITSIKESLNFNPNDVDIFKVPMLDEEPLIKTYVKRLIDPSKDLIGSSVVFAWNDREKFSKVKSYDPLVCCPFLGRVETELFIAPDGSCYSCCLDSKCSIIFGNVKTENLDSIFNGSKRAGFLEKLRARKFIEIGEPCSSVICCRNLKK